jgi:hypothetical protein
MPQKKREPVAAHQDVPLDLVSGGVLSRQTLDGETAVRFHQFDGLPHCCIARQGHIWMLPHVPKNRPAVDILQGSVDVGIVEGLAGRVRSLGLRRLKGLGEDPSRLLDIRSLAPLELVGG